MVRKLFIKSPFEKIFITQGRCCESEKHAAVGADDGFRGGAVAAKVFQIAASTDGFHERKEQKHGF